MEYYEPFGQITVNLWCIQTSSCQAISHPFGPSLRPGSWVPVQVHPSSISTKEKIFGTPYVLYEDPSTSGQTWQKKYIYIYIFMYMTCSFKLPFFW